MARLSLCMIARDEERFLPGCLASVRGVVDEVVITDTGSTDGTVDIARAFGAIVRFLAWPGDFSVARNDALEGTSGDWILWLDADERLASGAGAALRRAIEEDDFDYGMLTLHNATRLDAPEEEVLAGRARAGEPVLLPRLLRRTPDLAWEGRVHESVGQWVVRGERRQRVVEAPLVHFGTVPEVFEVRGKNGRNLELLRQRVVEEPDSVTTYSYLAAELFRRGASEEGQAIVERGWSVFLRQRADLTVRPAIVHLTHYRAEGLAGHGRFEEALTTLAVAREYGASHPNLDYCEAGVLVFRNRLARNPDAADMRRALLLLESCRASHHRVYGEEVIHGIFGHASYHLSGEACLMAGRPIDALGYFEAVLAERPEHLAARLGIAEARLDLGDPRGALAAVRPLLGEGGADAWCLAAAATARLGARMQAQRMAQRALVERARGLGMPRRLYRLESIPAG